MLASVAAMAAVVACTPSGEQSRRTDGAGLSLTLSFTQLLPYEGTERGLLRVENDAAVPVEVTRIGLDWPGYGPAFRQDKVVSIGAGRTMTLKLTLPEPVCADTDVPVRGIVESGEQTIRQRLSPAGQRYLRRLWKRQCSTRYVAERLDIEYDDRWVVRGDGDEARALGVLRLTRRAGDDPVELLAVQGSVLYELALTGATALAPGADTLAAPVAILPGNRCDEHARSQATAPFTFRLRLRVGEADPTKLLIPPPSAGQAAATDVLNRACGPL